jgi:hypothetical protein
MDPDLLNKFPNQKNQSIFWKYEDDPVVYLKFTQYVQHVDEITSTHLEKPKKQNPIEFAANFCIAENDYIKQKLLDFISIKEFQTVFGVKNTTEIMKGIVNNKWNKQLAILFSFLFDVAFVYLKKNVMFDATKSYTKTFSI